MNQRHLVDNNLGYTPPMGAVQIFVRSLSESGLEARREWRGAARGGGSAEGFFQVLQGFLGGLPRSIQRLNRECSEGIWQIYRVLAGFVMFLGGTPPFFSTARR